MYHNSDDDDDDVIMITISVDQHKQILFFNCFTEEFVFYLSFINKF